jgi:hypothetical protein
MSSNLFSSFLLFLLSFHPLFIRSHNQKKYKTTTTTTTNIL